MNIESFKGNILTEEERTYRLIKLKKELQDNRIDEEFIPYINSINHYDFIVTTQCCTGHYEGGYNAHFDFRSKLSEKDVIDKLLRPMDEKFDPIRGGGVSIQLMPECGRLRYCLWLKDDIWKKQVSYFLRLLKNIQKEREIKRGEQSAR